jgi:replicative DNA helicase
MTDTIVLPSAFEAENAVIGTILSGVRNAYELAAETLTPEHFADPANGRIFEIAGSLYDQSRDVNAVSIRPMLETDPVFKDLDPGRIVAGQVASMVSTRQIPDYAGMIFDAWLRREMMSAADELKSDSAITSPERGGRDILAEHEQRLTKIADSRRRDTQYSITQTSQTALANIRRNMAEKGVVIGVRTGLHALDKRLGGMRAGQLIILAARPGMGKTALAGSIALNAGMDNAVGFLSLEMEAEELTERKLATIAGIDSKKIGEGNLTDAELEQLERAAETLDARRIFYDDEGGLTLSQIRSKARKMKRRQNIDLLIIDYLQLIRGSGRRDANRVQDVTEITVGLKALAKELKIPVLALSQLSRQVEGRDDKRPLLSDLRESGSIEQDADVVIFIYREEYYLQNEEPVQKANETQEKFTGRTADWRECMSEVTGKADLIIAKQRRGTTGSVKTGFDGPTTRFYDLGGL